MSAPTHLGVFLREEGRRFEQFVEQFELAWLDGREPDLANFLPPDGPGRLPVLLELIHTDVEYRRRRGIVVPVETYLERFPELQCDRSLLLGMTAPDREVRPAERGPAPWPPERFKLLDPLGAGSFGLVYKAWDTELERVVAIKVPRADRTAVADAADQFLREARSAARLHHPHIVALHEARQADGFCYLVMEYIPGTTLAQRLAASRPSIRQAATWAAQMADALAYAHAEGVIHRDLKPANVLLDADDRPHLTDFGLAARAGADDPPDGAVVGTPAYMPPEQARGEAHRADGRGDQYSLGVILYEMLTGRIPFDGSGPDLIQRILAEEPPAPRQLCPTVPADLDAICRKSMAKAPDRRYPTAAALADDLRRFLAGQPVTARPPGPAGRALRWARREPALAALAAALVVVAGVGFAAVFAEWRRAEANLAATQRREGELAVNLRRADQAIQRLNQLAGVSLRSEDHAPPTRVPALQISIDYCEDFVARHNGDPAVKPQLARVFHRLAMFRHALHREDAADAFARAVTVRAELMRDHPDDPEYRIALANSCCYFGRLHKDAGRQDEAVPRFERAAELLTPVLHLSTAEQNLYSRLCVYHAELGYAYRKLGRSADALRVWERVVTVAESLSPGIFANESLRAHHAIGHFWVGKLEAERGRLVAALAAHHRAAELFAPLRRDFPDSERYRRFDDSNAQALARLESAEGKQSGVTRR